jgi:tripartite-type tricarboxylate transporter receptor subunit TctC
MQHMTRRSVLATALLTPVMAQAQSWPSGRANIIVPFPAGGSTDAIARLVQPGLQQRLGIPLIIDNRGGGSGSIGANAAAKSPGDGGTWLFVFDTHAVIPALIPSVAYDTEKDLAPVMLIGTAPMILATQKDKPFKTMADVIAAAKAKPGGVTYGSIGNGSLGHLTMVLLAKQAGIQITHVPYRGGGPAINDAVAGHIDLVITSSANVAAQLAGGTLRPLMQTAKERGTIFKDIPTANESGFPGFDANAWWAVFAPATTPAPIIERFRADLEATFKDERVNKQLVETQQVTLSLGGPDVLKAFLADQMKVWGAVVRDNGIRPD